MLIEVFYDGKTEHSLWSIKSLTCLLWAYAPHQLKALILPY